MAISCSKVRLPMNFIKSMPGANQSLITIAPRALQILPRIAASVTCMIYDSQTITSTSIPLKIIPSPKCAVTFLKRMSRLRSNLAVVGGFWIKSKAWLSKSTLFLTSDCSLNLLVCWRILVAWCLYPRHEYFRRILCHILGNDIERGYLTSEMDFGALVSGVCYKNAKNYFNL